jgi:hypothetical protein
MLIISMHHLILLQFHLVPTLNAIYVCTYVRTFVCFHIQTDTHINYSKCTREIKSRIAMAKAAFNKKTFLFTSNLNLDLREKLVKLLHFEHSFVWWRNQDTSRSRSEIPEIFPNVVMEKEGDQLDRSCAKWSVLKQCDIVRGIPENIDSTGNETLKPK